MPPRKRVHRTASTEAGEERSRNRRSSPHEHEAHNPASTRQWTDEEEMALLRSVIRMKPVGPFTVPPLAGRTRRLIR